MRRPAHAIAAIFTLVLLPQLSTANAAGWANQLFPVKSHNFGSVAVASQTEFVFPIQNRTGQDIHIARVRASCGCTTPILKEQWIKAGETGALTARFNTRTFTGQKGATLTVVIDRPRYAEVQLRVDGYIRRDIVFDPGVIDFGQISQGSVGQTEVAVAYAGRSDWQILGVESDAGHVQATIEETGRTRQRVNYMIRARLSPDTAAGRIREQLILRTNDRSRPRVPLAVRGMVTPTLRVAPEAFSVNELPVGEAVRQRLVVTGERPFRISSITCEGFDVHFEAVEELRKAHVMQIELTPRGGSGERKSRLVVTGEAEQSEWTAEAVVTGTIL